MPETKAMNKSAIRGVPRDKISLVKCSIGVSKPIRKLIPKDAKKPNKIEREALIIIGTLPWTKAKPVAKIGVIKGATNIAPITTATELLIKPKAAIEVESNIKETKSKFQVEFINKAS